MIIGIIGAVICWFISKSIIASILVFYFLTGIIKSIRWKFMRFTEVPPLVQGSLIKGIFLWPIIVISNLYFDIFIARR